jgi:hypothetical protein
MVDENQIATSTDTALSEPEPAVSGPDTGMDHPHAGVPEAGWSVPVPQTGEVCHLAKLVVKRGGVETDVEFSLAPPAIIGRFDPAVGPVDIDLAPLPEGSYVSRKHAKIWRDGDSWRIEDMGSSNGTFILKSDFERVTDSELQDGDEIALGNARFVFHITA